MWLEGVSRWMGFRGLRNSQYSEACLSVSTPVVEFVVLGARRACVGVTSRYGGSLFWLRLRSGSMTEGEDAVSVPGIVIWLVFGIWYWIGTERN